jgi:hypothetical protein
VVDSPARFPEELIFLPLLAASLVCIEGARCGLPPPVHLFSDRAVCLDFHHSGCQRHGTQGPGQPDSVHQGGVPSSVASGRCFAKSPCRRDHWWSSPSPWWQAGWLPASLVQDHPRATLRLQATPLFFGAALLPPLPLGAGADATGDPGWQRQQWWRQPA